MELLSGKKRKLQFNKNRSRVNQDKLKVLGKLRIMLKNKQLILKR